MADTGIRRRGAPAEKDGTAGSTTQDPKEEPSTDIKGDGKAAAAAAAASEAASVKGPSGAAKGSGGKRGSAPPRAPPLRWDEVCSMAMTVVTAAVTVWSTYYIVQQMRSRPNPHVSFPAPSSAPPSAPPSAPSAFQGQTAASFPPSSVGDGSAAAPPAGSAPVPAGSELASPGEKLWTPEELAKHDGSDPKLPLLLGCIGEVFDVTKGKKHYAKGEGYNHFCGRDASRAFVSGNFSGDGLTDDLSQLSYENLVGVEGWRDFYHKTYKPAGRLVGRYYNSTGHPTKNLTRLERQLKRAKEQKEKQEAEDKKHPGCNSYWSSKEGGRVYCDQGYPRMRFSVVQSGEGQTSQRTRCICLDEQQIAGRADLKVVEGCDPWSNSCQTAPPLEA